MDVEALLTKNIWRIGGVHVSSLVGGSPSFDNADFLFEGDRVIAELKCLDDDLINEPHLIAKASEIHLQELKRTGRGPVVFGDQLVDTRGRSEEFVKGIRDLYYEPLKRCLKKASKQIKATAEHFGMQDYSGLAVIANNNHTAIDPWHALELIKEAFRRERLSGINSVLYLSAGLGIEVVGESRQFDIMLEYRSPHRPELGRQFLLRFQQVWMGALASHMGIKPPDDMLSIGPRVLAAIRNRSRSG